MTATTYRTDPVDHDRASEDDLALRGAYDAEAPACRHCGERSDYLVGVGLCLECGRSVGR